MSVESQVEASLNKLQGELTAEESANLSKILFPDEHVTSAIALGKKRELRPMTVKWARKIRACMQPYAKKLEDATKSPGTVDIDLDLLEGLYNAVKIMADYYEWEDIKAAVDEEDLTTSELQALVTAQVTLQGENDFLFIPLRVAVMIMQAVEIQNRRYRSIFGG